MPENEAPRRALYDHETEEPRATGRRRRQVADWGVGEDVFDRMPSRRLTRGAPLRAPRPDEPGARERRDEFAGHDAGADDASRDDLARRREAADWLEEVTPLPPEIEAPEPRRTIVIGGAVEDEIEAPEPRHTIVIGGVAEDELAPPARRTIVIGGHPDGGLPVVRNRRPPQTALERVGARPDRIVAYAVALGFLLILIAVLTTGH